MQIAEAQNAEIRPHDKDHRAGLLDNRILLCGEEGTPDNFKLNISYAREEWETPRHRHDFDQIRVPLEGEFIYAQDKVLKAGEAAFFPAGVYYGPQLRKRGLLMMLCQLGSADGQGFVSTAQREAVFDQLKAKGTFKDGIYTYVDENSQKHNQDAAEAVREAATGHKVKYPTPRYGDIITMNLESYKWIVDPAQPGVTKRVLGSFNERTTEMGQLRLEAGATFNAGMQITTELLFLMHGKIEAAGQTYAEHTAFGLKPKEGPVPLKAVEDSVFFYIHLPRFN
jgi:hypothetical protein